MHGRLHLGAVQPESLRRGTEAVNAGKVEGQKIACCNGGRAAGHGGAILGGGVRVAAAGEELRSVEILLVGGGHHKIFVEPLVVGAAQLGIVEQVGAVQKDLHTGVKGKGIDPAVQHRVAVVAVFDQPEGQPLRGDGKLVQRTIDALPDVSELRHVNTDHIIGEMRPDEVQLRQQVIVGDTDQLDPDAAAVLKFRQQLAECLGGRIFQREHGQLGVRHPLQPGEGIGKALGRMGNVLVRFDPELFMDRYSLTGEDRRLIRNEVFRSVEWTMLDRGVIDEEIAEQRILPRLPERLHDAARGLIETWDDPIVPVEGMLELLQALKAKGYRLYLLSNAATRQPIYWARAEASKLMDGALISAEVKLLKPDPQIYRTFLRKFALRPEECVFIDDTPINVEGALYENMAGIVFNMDVAALAQSLHALGVEW